MADSSDVPVNIKINVGEGAGNKAAVNSTKQGLESIAAEAKSLPSAFSSSASSLSSSYKIAANEVTSTFSDVKAQFVNSFNEAGSAVRSSLSSAFDGLKDAKPTLDSMAESGEKVSSTFGKLGIVLTGASAAIVAIGAKTVSTAGEFQALQTQLESVTGSSERAAQAFSLAVKKAAVSPFDVQGVVKATTTIETFGQSSEKQLGRVLNLGAAFRDLSGASLAFSKAASGSQEGFESLRNTYGITTSALKAYGAETTKTGGIMVRTQAQIDKARTALEKIVDLRFGGFVERQANTFEGAISNVGDNIDQLAASFGNILLPTVTSAVKGINDVLQALVNAPESLKVATLAVGGLSAALLGIGGAAALGVAGLGVLGASVAGIASGLAALPELLASIGTAFPILATGATTASTAMIGAAGSVATFAGSLTTVSGIAGLVNGALATVTGSTFTLSGAVTTLSTTTVAGFGAAATAAFDFAAAVASALGPVGLAAAATAAAFVAFKRWEKSAKELGDELTNLSRKSAETNTEFRQFATDLEKGLGVQVDFRASGEGTARTVEALREALATMTPQQVIDGLAKANVSVKDLESFLESSRQKLKSTRDEMLNLSSALEKLKDSKKFGSAYVAFTPEEEAIIERFKGSIPEIESAVKSSRLEFSRLRTEVISFANILKALDPAKYKLEEAAKAASALDEYLKFAGREDDLGRLSNSISLIDQQLSKARESFEAANGAGSSSVDALLARLSKLDPNDEANAQQIAAIDKILSLEQKRETLVDKVAKSQAKASQKAAQAILDEINAKNSLLEADAKGLQAKRQNIQEGLALVEQGTKQEARLKTELAQVDREIEKQKTNDLRDQLAQRFADQKTLIDNAKNSGQATASSVEKVIKASIQSLESFHAANKSTFDKSSQIAKSYTNDMRALHKELDSLKDIRAEEAFDKLQKKLESSIEAATNAPDKLEQIKIAVDTLNSELSTVTTASARRDIEQEITRLKREEGTITKQIADAEAKLTNEISTLRRQALEQEIQLLEARKAAGEGVDNALMLKREELKQARLKAIDEEAAKARAANEDEVKIAERTALKKAAIEREYAIKKVEEVRKGNESIKKENDRAAREASRSDGNSSAASSAFSTAQGAGSTSLPTSAPSSSPLNSAPSLFSGFSTFSLGPGFASGFGQKFALRQGYKYDPSKAYVPKPPTKSELDKLSGTSSPTSNIKPAYYPQTTSDTTTAPASASSPSTINDNRNVTIITGDSKRQIRGRQSDQFMALIDSLDRQDSIYNAGIG